MCFHLFSISETSQVSSQLSMHQLILDLLSDTSLQFWISHIMVTNPQINQCETINSGGSTTKPKEKHSLYF